MKLKKRTLSVNSVVIIVLAMLLVLSISIGITGAWFTAEANLGKISLGSLQLGSIDITAEASKALLYGSTYTDGKYVMNKDPETERTVVVPGDYIKATITVTNNSTAPAYVLVYDKTAKEWYNLAGDPVTVDGSLSSAEADIKEGGTFEVTGSVPTTETDQSKTLDEFIELNYEVVAVQAVNISQADAWAELKARVAAQAQ